MESARKTGAISWRQISGAGFWSVYMRLKTDEFPAHQCLVLETRLWLDLSPGSSLLLVGYGLGLKGLGLTSEDSGLRLGPCCHQTIQVCCLLYKMPSCIYILRLWTVEMQSTSHNNVKMWWARPRSTGKHHGRRKPIIINTLLRFLQ